MYYYDDIILASCQINAQPFPAHRPAADDWQWEMIGRTGCPVPRAVPVPISSRVDAHFGARLGAFFIEPDVLKMYRSTIPLWFIWSICSEK